MARVLINIPDEMLKQLDEAAKTQHRSRSEMIREAVRRSYYSPPDRTPAMQARIAEMGREMEKARRKWKTGEDSTKTIRKMRDTR